MISRKQERDFFMFRIKNLPKNSIIKFYKSFIIFLADLLSTLAAVLLVIYINHEKSIETFSNYSQFLLETIIILGVQSFTNLRLGLYRGAWRFASIPDLIRIIQACISSTLILVFLNVFLKLHTALPLSTFPLFCLFSICLLSGPRLTYRWLKDNRKFFSKGKKVLVIGAGSAGESILRELKRKSNKDLLVVGLLDDDPSKNGIEIHGIRVLGSTHDLSRIVKEKNIELILIAIPRANSSQMRRIVSLCGETGIPYRTLPSINDIASGKTNITNIRQVTVEDLLGRDPIQFDHDKIAACIKNKKILVTGAGGSIGSELCRKIAAASPESIILIDSNEYNLFKIHSELDKQFPSLTLHCYLLSVTNHEMINQVMENHRPNFVFHAAAYKHVPLLEPQTRIAIENNIFGTQIIAEAAKQNNVEIFILVSTDKAVNPTNVMGATKRCVEILCQCLNQNSNTRFTTVRFGNVLGSTGSVIPLFEEQIANGGPVTVTHPDMERFFMTITEAAQLIIQTVTLDSASDLYVLDMGEPIKIQYLAEQMIKLSGHIPDTDIQIVYTGLRPGEKINEQLFYISENVQRINDGKIMRVNVPHVNYANFMLHLNKLKRACHENNNNLKKYLFMLANLENLDTISNNSSEIKIAPIKLLPMPLALEYY